MTLQIGPKFLLSASPIFVADKTETFVVCLDLGVVDGLF